MADLIDKQAAIDAIDCEADKLESSGAIPHAQGARTMRFVVDAQPSIAEYTGHWVPVTEKLPENRVSVLICYREWSQYLKQYRYTIVIGWHVNKYAVREDYFAEWEVDSDYCEEDDEFYIPEGWYELTTQGNSDEMNWYLYADVVAWMPLPEPYKKGGENA